MLKKRRRTEAKASSKLELRNQAKSKSKFSEACNKLLYVRTAMKVLYKNLLMCDCEQTSKSKPAVV